jgi:CRP-like cAMP-binding protein
MDKLNANRILSLLPLHDLERLTPHLERVHLPLGRVLYEAGDQLRYVYFPITAIISLLYVMRNGASAEISVVGRDGMLGVALFLGGGSTNSRAVVQSEGDAYRLLGSRLKSEFNLHGALMSTLMRYSQALFTQMSQTAVCNRHHTIEQQLCRWLLLSLDRLQGMDLVMTQELIANMLGVRREGVTEAAGRLQKLGVIEYHRGHIHVIDRQKLESLSCECYQVVKDEIDRLMPTARVRL